MLNFRNIAIVYALLLISFILLSIFWKIPLVAYLLFALSFLLFLFYGSYFIGSQFYMKVVCKGNTREKKIAFSFDDGPANFTPSILKILSEHNIKAVFFCIGKHIEHNEELLKQIDKEGHIIGNHSYSHCLSFDFWRTTEVLADLQKTHQLVKRVTGKNMRWFRPPFGVTNPNIAGAVSQMGYNAIGWNIRSLDTVTKDVAVLFNRVCKQIQPGAIILFHDICPVTVDVLPLLVKYLREQHYEILPLDKLLNMPPYAD